MRAKYDWLEMHLSRGTCLPVVHADCCFSEATCYGPTQSSSLIRSGNHQLINITISRYDIANTSLPRRYANTTQSQEVFMKAFGSFLFNLYILLLIRNLGQLKQDIAFIVTIWIIRRVPLVKQELSYTIWIPKFATKHWNLVGFSWFNMFGPVLWCMLYMIST